MKFKVFGIIFISLILVLLVNGVARVIGESLKDSAAKEIFSQASGSNKTSKGSLEDISKELMTSGFRVRYNKASKEITPKYYWYFGMLYIVQIVLMLCIALLASIITINFVKKGIKL